ncbi:hypothetical protein SAMN02745248_02318 [Hathewaya proteolytica DSM 3090]|uniref:Uncharacterized protein n=1 Tax=Hathewaya proteolytica DSM 3090 TaxID=1121331 RepID=A0A1M6RL86_9CLOT|nr:hypothetical protein [Hathewaya proteolytica]SHK33215.1 hypothetical protein SAMN02745248_02318 [Hathewaya proteolytica DSM 3090]
MEKNNESSMSTVLILWCLVVIMCFSGQFFYGKIKPASSVKNAKEVVQYDFWNDKGQNKHCDFPVHWEVDEDKNKETNNVRFYGTFKSQAENLYGYIKIFNNKDDFHGLINKECMALSQNHNVYHINNDKIENNNVKVTYCTVDVYNMKTYHESYFINNKCGNVEISFSKAYGGFDKEDRNNINTVLESIVDK